jgi:hypothetical protein
MTSRDHKAVVAWVLMRAMRFLVRRLHLDEIVWSVRFGVVIERWLVPRACWAELATCCWTVEPETLEDWLYVCAGRACREKWIERGEVCWCGKYGWGPDSPPTKSQPADLTAVRAACG